MKRDDRTRISMDCGDWHVIASLVKLRFDELVENSQGVSGEVRDTNRAAALELWDVIREFELQMPRYRRPDEREKRIVGPLRDWRSAARKLGVAALDEPIIVDDEEAA